MTPEESAALLIQYPSGGFGHFMYSLISTSSDVFCCRSQDIEFSGVGDSHQFELSNTRWLHNDPAWEFKVNDWAVGSDRRHIILIDPGIDNDSVEGIRDRYPNNQLIRMCIDVEARPILYQTCLIKAERKQQHQFKSVTDWEKREEVTLAFHYADNHKSFYLNHFQPIDDDNTLNVPVSWLFNNFHKLLDYIEDFLRIVVNRDHASFLHKEFLKANFRYFNAVDQYYKIRHALDAGTELDLSECVNIYDQGYINYCLERDFNIPEIPPYDYRNWFQSVNEIRDMIVLHKK